MNPRKVVNFTLPLKRLKLYNNVNSLGKWLPINSKKTSQRAIRTSQRLLMISLLTFSWMKKLHKKVLGIWREEFLKLLDNIEKIINQLKDLLFEVLKFQLKSLGREMMMLKVRYLVNLMLHSNHRKVWGLKIPPLLPLWVVQWHQNLFIK